MCGRADRHLKAPKQPLVGGYPNRKPPVGQRQTYLCCFGVLGVTSRRCNAARVHLLTCTHAGCLQPDPSAAQPSHLSAGPSLPMSAVPSHSRGGSLADAALAAAAVNGSGYADSGSKYGLDGSQGEEAVAAAGALGGGGGGASWQQRPASAAVLGAAGSGPAEVVLDVEMAARASSAPILDEPERPPSPVKQAAAAAQQAWSAISGLPRRMAGGGPAHRRTESQEPVLLMEDKSTGSAGI